MPAAPFLATRNVRRGALLLAMIGAGLAASAWQAQVDPRLLWTAEARGNVAEFARGMFPPELSFPFLRMMAAAAVETVQISVIGMVIAILIGFPLGLVATATLTWSGVLNDRQGPAARLVAFAGYAGARGILSVLRSVPELVWGLIFVRATGLGPFAGVLAIGVAYGGMLGKVYSEILESLNPRPAETLQAAGAGRIGIIAYAMVPAALPGFVSYTFYRWECAIRASAILGFVGAGGLGQQIELSLRMANFREVLTLLLILSVLVATVEMVSAVVRRRVTGASRA